MAETTKDDPVQGSGIKIAGGSGDQHDINTIIVDNDVNSKNQDTGKNISSDYGGSFNQKRFFLFDDNFQKSEKA